MQQRDGDRSSAAQQCSNAILEAAVYALNVVLMGGGGKIHYTVTCRYFSDWKDLDCIDRKALLLQRVTWREICAFIGSSECCLTGQTIYLDKLSIFF